MVIDAVGSSEKMQKEVLVLLCQYSDEYEALYWARFYKIPFDDAPYNVKEIWNSSADKRYYEHVIYFVHMFGGKVVIVINNLIVI